MNAMQDIKVKVWGQDGMTSVDEIVINPGSDDPQSLKEEDEFGNTKD